MITPRISCDERNGLCQPSEPCATASACVGGIKGRTASTGSLPAALLASNRSNPSALVGELVAVTRDQQCALVRYPGQPGTAAVPARSTVDLRPCDIGRAAVLVFDGGDMGRPILMGFLRGGETWSLADPPAQVEVDADGQRMRVSAKHELVLRCGNASITLTASGKLVIQATQIVSESSGMHRIRGASVEIN